MENRLIIQLNKKGNEWSEIEKELELIFENKLTKYELSLNPKIKERITSFRGEMNTYKILFGSKNFPSSVFDLMIKLEELGIDWKFRKPVQIFPLEYLFVASLYPEFGQISIDGISGICVQLFEGLEEH